MKEFWLARKMPGGLFELCDGPHDDRAGAEEAKTLIERLRTCHVSGVSYAIAELSDPTGVHAPVNETAIQTILSASGG